MNYYLKIGLISFVSAIVGFTITFFLMGRTVRPTYEKIYSDFSDPVELSDIDDKTNSSAEVRHNKVRDSQNVIPIDRVDEVENSDVEVEDTVVIRKSSKIVRIQLDVLSNVAAFISCQIGENSYSYSLKYNANNPYFTCDVSNDEIEKYVLESGEGGRYESDNGTFKGVMPVKGGKYQFFAISNTGNISNVVEISGFGIRQAVVSKLDKSTLEAIINSGDYEMNVKPQIAGKVSDSMKITSVNTDFFEGDRTIQQVMSYVSLEKWIVTVEEIRYNSLGYVTAIVLNAHK